MKQIFLTSEGMRNRKFNWCGLKINHRYCTYAVRGTTCQLQSFLAYFAQLLCCYKLRRNLVASYLILASWSSLEISTFVVDRICKRESAECVGKQGAHSEWAKDTTLLHALSRTEGRNHQAGSRARLLGDGCG